MAGVTPPHRQFNAGEITSLLSGRDDLQWYQNACVLMENTVPVPHGPSVRRAGTRFINWCRGTGAVRLLRFEASVNEAYVIEATDHTFRFWTDLAQVESSPGVPLEITTPYPEAILQELRAIQSTDLMWIFHPTIVPHTLKRTGPASFVLEPYVFIDGPYLAENITTTTLTPAATEGHAVAVEASADVFVASDVNRMIRIMHKVDEPAPTPDRNQWGWGIIIAVADARHCTVDVGTPFGGTTASVAWRLGLYGGDRGWPCCGTIHQERLALGSNPVGSFPRVDLSMTGAFNTFTPGTEDDTAIAIAIGAESLPIIRDLVSMRTLIVLTATTEFSIGPEGTNEPLTPSNSGAVPISYEGAADRPVLTAKKAALFMHRTGRVLYEIARTIESDGLRTRDISVRGEHILEEEPLSQMAWANRPYNVLWQMRRDGRLVGVTYQPDQEVIAWQRHPLGGNGVVEGLATTPASDGDELWLAVRRGPSAPISMEVLRFPLKPGEHPGKAFYVDQGLSIDATVETVPIALQTTPGGDWIAGAPSPIFQPAHVGREITGWYLEGREPNGQPCWRPLDARVIGVASGGSQARLESLDGRTPTVALQAGDWRFKVTELSGLAHLEGVAVMILADAAPVTGKVVRDGKVTLDQAAGFIHVGRAYRSRTWPTRLDAGSQMGSNIGKKNRVRSIAVRLVRSGPCMVGMAAGKLEEAPVRRRGNRMDRPPPLSSRDVRVPIESDVDDELFVAVESELPLPLTIVAIVPSQEVGDTG